MIQRFILATRKSPLALAQAELVAARLREFFPGTVCDLLKVVTTGDRQRRWSLEKEGGKGLFTAELEAALLGGEAQVAVHSAKDLPNESSAGLSIAGYLAREDPRDVLVRRVGVGTPATIATSSPRRRLQISRKFPGAGFTEIRGNVDTRLKKIAAGAADATVLAAAGLKRLGISSWPGLEFHPLAVTEMAPAIGQGAIALQCRTEDVDMLRPATDAKTNQQLAIERALQKRLGGGCQIAFAAHVAGETLHIFHEKTGTRAVKLTDDDWTQVPATVDRVMGQLGLTA